MKGFSIFAIAALVVASAIGVGPAGIGLVHAATPQFVGSAGFPTTCQDNATGTCSVTFSTTPGDAAIVFFGASNAGGIHATVTSVVDTGGSSYTRQKTLLPASGDYLELWSTNGTGVVGSTSITVNYAKTGAGNFLDIFVAEYRGFKTALGAAVASGPIGGAPSLAASFALTNPGDFFVTGFFDFTTCLSQAVTSGNLRLSVPGGNTNLREMDSSTGTNSLSCSASQSYGFIGLELVAPQCSDTIGSRAGCGLATGMSLVALVMQVYMAMMLVVLSANSLRQRGGRDATVRYLKRTYPFLIIVGIMFFVAWMQFRGIP